MADYIYLLQHRLIPTQRRALEAVRDAARHAGAPVFLVGGTVRDLTSGAPVRDMDFAVQGDVAGLLEALAVAGARLTGENKGLQSRYFVFPGGVRVEVGPTLAVSYPQPGLPEVQTAPILDDLRRRDFTANAMAISLNEGSYGLLLDPMNGVADLENRELRLVSNLGFIEQPALLIRAARLSNRLGWNLEERTQRRYENAKEEEAIGRLSPEARGYELEEIFHEEDPLSALEYLGSEGWLLPLSPVFGGLKPDQEGLDRVRDTLGQMEQLGIFPDPSAVYFPLLAAKLPGAEVSAIKAAFARPGFSEQIESLEGRSRELASQLTAKAASLPSATWKLLFEAEPEVVLFLGSSSRTGAVQAKFKAFFTDWPQARQRTPYALMQEMRITPDIAGYEQLLQDLFFASMDNRLSTPEETRAFLEPFSPPAPAQQVTPRRRAAKSARGRGKPAAAAASSKRADADVDVDEADEDDDVSGSSAEAGRGERNVRVADRDDANDDDAEDDGRRGAKEDDEDDENEETENAPVKPVPARPTVAVKKTSHAAEKSTETNAPPPASKKAALPAAEQPAAVKQAAATKQPKQPAKEAPVVVSKDKPSGNETPERELPSTKAPGVSFKKAVVAPVVAPVKGAGKVEPAAVKGTAKDALGKAAATASKPGPTGTKAPATGKVATTETAATKKTPVKEIAAKKAVAKKVAGKRVAVKKTAAVPADPPAPEKQATVSAKKTAGKAGNAVPAKRSLK